jgi:Mn2+/Fe2+ NRAMP family transporter
MTRRRAVRHEADFSKGLSDHHDPLAGIGGAPPAYSALTLRLVLAIFGLVFCSGAAIAAAIGGVVWLVIAMVIGAVIAAVDIAVIVYRKRRGEPG